MQQATCEMIDEMETQRQHEGKTLIGKLPRNESLVITSSVPVFDLIADERKGGGRLISDKENRLEELSVEKKPIAEDNVFRDFLATSQPKVNQPTTVPSPMDVNKYDDSL